MNEENRTKKTIQTSDIHTVFIGIGSNIAPEDHIRKAVGLLSAKCTLLEVSPVYESPAAGFEGDNFLNLVIKISTPLSLARLHEELRTIEDLSGRDRSGPKFGPRTLDLDVLLYDELVSDRPTIPHGDIIKYSFVLRPLADIAGGKYHPTLKKTYSQLLEELDPEPKNLDLRDLKFFHHRR